MVSIAHGQPADAGGRRGRIAGIRDWVTAVRDLVGAHSVAFTFTLDEDDLRQPSRGTSGAGVDPVPDPVPEPRGPRPLPRVRSLPDFSLHGLLVTHHVHVRREQPPDDEPPPGEPAR